MLFKEIDGPENPISMLLFRLWQVPGSGLPPVQTLRLSQPHGAGAEHVLERWASNAFCKIALNYAI